MTNHVPSWIKNVWGSNSSKGFRLGAWGAALGAFGLWYYVDNHKPELKTLFYTSFGKDKK
ncbi:hypothetical protein EON65_20825 [archaeon]|nr:MAG: hypothetical protein EON65_20825 [archaeon]